MSKPLCPCLSTARKGEIVAELIYDVRMLRKKYTHQPSAGRRAVQTMSCLILTTASSSSPEYLLLTTYLFPRIFEHSLFKLPLLCED